MSHPLEDEDTWDEEEGRRLQEPLEIRVSIRPASPRTGAECRRNAARLLAELMELPEERRTRHLREQRFHEPALLDLLLETCHDALPFAVRRAAELAMLAVELSSLLLKHGEHPGDEAFSRALCLAGTARRLVGDLAIADAAFEQAGPLAVSPSERGFFCRALALLRWDQGRMEETLALLHQGGQRFAEGEDFAQQAVCRALLGLLHLEQGEPTRACPFLSQASLDLDGKSRSWLAAQTWLGLALCWAAGGRREKARSARQRAWDFYGAVREERALLALHWLEGRVAYVLGEAQESGALLEEVRRTLIDRRLLPEAALATLDLGLLWLVTGRGKEMGLLVEEIAAAFADRPGLDLALSALARPAEDALAGRLSPEAWSGMAPILRLAFRLQGVPLQPVLFV